MKLTEIKGLGPKTEEKLNAVGITDVYQFLSRTPNDIRNITGVDFETAAKYFRNAQIALREAKEIENNKKNGLEVEDERKHLKIVSTGCKPLDDLLLGGMETKATYELYGEFGSNKTQICHHMMVRVQLLEKDGGLSTEEKPAKVAVIDTEHTFRPERIRSIAERYGLDPDKTLENITQYDTINSVSQQMNLEDIEELIRNDNVKLVVIDSLMGLFRNEYPGRGELSDRQSKVNNFVGLAGRLTRVYKICVLMTNQVSSNPDGFHFEPQAIGGNVVAHASTYRIFLKKSGKNRIARMIDSPHHPDGECMFKVTEQGIMTIEEAEEFEKEQKKEKSKEKAAETRAKNKSKKETLDEDESKDLNNVEQL